MDGLHSYRYTNMTFDALAMALPTRFLKNVFKSVLEDLGLDPNSKQDCQKIEAHLLISCLHRVSVQCQDRTGTITKNFIIKTLRQDSEINRKFDTQIFFKNEAVFYTQLLEPFKFFQNLWLSKEFESFQSTPKCYKAVNTYEHSVLVLEDLRERGFVETPREKILSLAELFLVMKELGRFHALSIAMKCKEPAFFSALKRKFKEPVYRREFIEKAHLGWSSAVASWTCKLAKDYFKPGSLYVKKLETFATDCMSYFMKDVIRPREEDEQFNVFTHGDLWVNNLLFHYPDAESEIQQNPDKMCFVDFQQCRYGSVALDLSAALFLLMDQEMRNNHRDELLGMYHHSLSEFLGQLGFNPNKLFPFSALKSQLSKYSLFGLGLSFLCLSYNLNEEGNDDVKDNGEYVKETTESCRKRILDVIKECVDRGYL